MVGSSASDAVEEDGLIASATDGERDIRCREEKDRMICCRSTPDSVRYVEVLLADEGSPSIPSVALLPLRELLLDNEGRGRLDEVLLLLAPLAIGSQLKLLKLGGRLARGERRGAEAITGEVCSTSGVVSGETVLSSAETTVGDMTKELSRPMAPRECTRGRRGAVDTEGD